MSPHASNDILQQLVVTSETEYLSLADIVAAAAELAGDASQPPDLHTTLALLRRVLARGFQAIDVGPGGEAIPWPDQNADAVTARIRAAWETAADPRKAAYSFWFDLPDGRRGG